MSLWQLWGMACTLRPASLHSAGAASHQRILCPHALLLPAADPSRAALMRTFCSSLRLWCMARRPAPTARRSRWWPTAATLPRPLRPSLCACRATTLGERQPGCCARRAAATTLSPTARRCWRASTGAVCEGLCLGMHWCKGTSIRAVEPAQKRPICPPSASPCSVGAWVLGAHGAVLMHCLGTSPARRWWKALDEKHLQPVFGGPAAAAAAAQTSRDAGPINVPASSRRG